MTAKYISAKNSQPILRKTFNANPEKNHARHPHQNQNRQEGEIEITLFASKAPMTVANFLNLASKKYYDGLKFHRVLNDFMIQGGDPTGTGAGGPGYKFADEFVKELTFDKPGLLAMANAGPRTNGSQFFITHVPTARLNQKHTIFGAVTMRPGCGERHQAGRQNSIHRNTGPHRTELFTSQADRITQWNSALKK